MNLKPLQRPKHGVSLLILVESNSIKNTKKTANENSLILLLVTHFSYHFLLMQAMTNRYNLIQLSSLGMNGSGGTLVLCC